MTTTSYNWNQFDQDISKLAESIKASDWKPVYIVAMGESGAVPAVALSAALGAEMKFVHVNVNNVYDTESNLWMSEDAFGYEGEPLDILLVDSVNRNGASFEMIKNDWQSSCLPEDPKWETIWGRSVRTAALHDCITSPGQESNYAANSIAATKIIYPWMNLANGN